MKKTDALTKKQVERTLNNLTKPVGSRLPPLPRGDSKSSGSARINCHECINFFITWQTSTPYGCKAHGFKSAQIPSMVVFASSGEHCLLFRHK